MFKFEVGKLYRVGMRNIAENGNVIRITEAIVRHGSPGFRYETVKGKEPLKNTFSADSKTTGNHRQLKMNIGLQGGFK